MDSLRIGSIIVLCDFSWPLSTYSQPAMVYSILRNNLKMIYFSPKLPIFFFKVTSELDKKKLKILNLKITVKNTLKKYFQM